MVAAISGDMLLLNSIWSLQAHLDPPLVQLARSSARGMSSGNKEKYVETYQELFKFPEQ